MNAFSESLTLIGPKQHRHMDGTSVIQAPQIWRFCYVTGSIGTTIEILDFWLMPFLKIAFLNPIMFLFFIVNSGGSAWMYF